MRSLRATSVLFGQETEATISHRSLGGLDAVHHGTASMPFTPTEASEGLPRHGATPVLYSNILFMNAYQNFSLEELRMEDYRQGRRYGNP